MSPTCWVFFFFFFKQENSHTSHLILCSATITASCTAIAAWICQHTSVSLIQDGGIDMRNLRLLSYPKTHFQFTALRLGMPRHPRQGSEI